MKMLPSRYASGNVPSHVKKKASLYKLAHAAPPAKGMSAFALTNETDPEFASIIDNLYVDDDRVSVRAGFKKISTCTGAAPVEHLIPHYGTPERLAAATNLTLCDAATGLVWRSGFTSNDWHWTSHSNLGSTEYTVMVNGADGVWGWDGMANPALAAVTVTKIAGGPAVGPPPPANPCQVTVDAADIAKFASGKTVIIAGADASHALANGAHRITSVNNPANTFSLVGVDLTGAPSDQTTGTMTATVQGSFEKLAVTVPVGNTWLNPNEFAIVLAHQNRLWFADKTNLAVYYLPIQAKDGVLAVLPVNSIFKRGGTIRAMATWTVDGGMGMDDQLVIFSTNGEAAIYSGVDPASDFSLVGVFRSDPPMSKHSVVNYGGELMVLLPTGVTPMTTQIKSQLEGIDAVDPGMLSYFLKHSIAHRDRPGWSLFLNPSSGRLFANLPLGGGRYNQAIRRMPKPIWSTFSGVPSRCWSWAQPYVYFGDDKGNVYQMHPNYKTDAKPDGTAEPIRIDLQLAWSQYKTPALKHFKMLQAYIVTDGNPKYAVDIKVDYDDSQVLNTPEIADAADDGAVWDLAVWDEASWGGVTRAWANWTGVGGLGRVGAIRFTARIANCSFAITGFGILYEEGTVFG
jgi:hypothetical protein